jgi:hypothetical protein
VIKAGCVSSLSADSSRQGLPCQPMQGAALHGNHGTGFAHHRCGRDDVCHWVYIKEGIQSMFSRLGLLGLSFGILSTVMGCAATPPPMAPLRATLAPAAPAAVAPPATPAPSEVPPAVAPLPYRHPPYATGTRGSDVYQPSPYERKMDKEERDYRRRRSAQEQDQEQRYQQWQQERARERDPRYEWMR